MQEHIEKIIAASALASGIKPKEANKRCRKIEYIYYRKVCIVLLKEFGLSYREISEHLHLGYYDVRYHYFDAISLQSINEKRFTVTLSSAKSLLQ